MSRVVAPETSAIDGRQCPICGAGTRSAGTSRGRVTGRDFQLRQCPGCWFAFVADPGLGVEHVYNETYFAGCGPDRFVDFAGESRDPRATIRRHEWLGIERRVRSLVTVTAESTWLDYGSGVGGLVAFLRERGVPRADGFEPSPAAKGFMPPGVEMVSTDRLADLRGQFDVVTAIEVLEHVPDPVAELALMRSLLRPGGLLFVTTGNARPHRNRLSAWRYVMPEVHISFYEPATLAGAMERAGLQPTFPGYGPGWTGIVRYRILKRLRLRRNSPLDRLVPWPLVCCLVNWRVGLAAQPVGWNSPPPGA